MTAIAISLPSTAQFDAGGIANYLLVEASDPGLRPSDARALALQEMDRHRSEILRTIILRGLDAAIPVGSSETTLLFLAQAVYPDAKALELRLELDRMESEALIIPSRGADIAPWYEPTERGIALAGKYRPEAWHH